MLWKVKQLLYLNYWTTLKQFYNKGGHFGVVTDNTHTDTVQTEDMKLFQFAFFENPARHHLLRLLLSSTQKETDGPS